MKLSKFLIIMLITVFVLPTVVGAATLFDAKIGKTSLIMDFAPFYAPLDWFIPLTSSPMPTIKSQKELVIYGHLLRRFFLPRFIVFELGVYPLPLLGVGIKSWAPKFYDKSEVFDGFNIVKSVTVSHYEEPWTASLFLGNVVDFSSQPETVMMTNGTNIIVTTMISMNPYVGKGYSGLLFSYGSHHIKNNDLIADDWLEIELKLKGKRWKDKALFSWSYRFGGRIHSHDDIKSYYYFGLRREHLDKNFFRFNLFKNSFIDMTFRFDSVGFNFLNMYFMIGKKFPIRGSRLLPELTIGVRYNNESSYNNLLALQDDVQLELIISPMLSF